MRWPSYFAIGICVRLATATLAALAGLGDSFVNVPVSMCQGAFVVFLAVILAANSALPAKLGAGTLCVVGFSLLCAVVLRTSETQLTIPLAMSLQAAEIGPPAIVMIAAVWAHRRGKASETPSEPDRI